MKDYYQILGIKKEASSNEIKKAYFSMAKKYHPDSSDNKEVELFYKITEAYKFLSDNQKKVDDLFQNNKPTTYSHTYSTKKTDKDRQKEAEAFYKTQLLHGFFRVIGFALITSILGFAFSHIFNGYWHLSLFFGFILGFILSLYKNFDISSFIQQKKKQQIINYIGWGLFGISILYFLILLI